MVSYKILDGKKIADEKLSSIKKEIERTSIKASLAVILVGDSAASKIYVNIKRKACQEIGIESQVITFPGDVESSEVISKIAELNSDSSINGILVQLPLPSHLDERKILDSIECSKDVDGLNSTNLANILLDRPDVIPCTPKGILDLLDFYDISLHGKDVCIVGYSNIIGKPLAALCLNRGATVDICHVHTSSLKDHTKRADIIMTATGVKGLIDKEMVKAGAVVIDIGITKVGKQIFGDVDFESVKGKVSYITPVPGGVGPMTVFALMENTIYLAKKQTQ